MLTALVIKCIGQTAEIPWVNEPKTGAVGVAHHVLKSKRNGVNIGYCVYLPANFQTSNKHYPLVVFLHGSGGNENSDVGGFSTAVNEAIAVGAFPESVILFPNGRKSGYQDHPERSEYIETWLIKELIPYAEKEFRCGGHQNQRVLFGFSMGGAGATRLGLNFPDMFAGVVAYGGSGGRSGAAFQSLNRNAKVLRERGFRIYMGVGEQDNFAQAEPFRRALDAAKIENVYRVLPGVGHDLGVYYTLTEDALRFVGKGIKSHASRVQEAERELR